MPRLILVSCVALFTSISLHFIIKTEVNLGNKTVVRVKKIIICNIIPNIK